MCWLDLHVICLKLPSLLAAGSGNQGCCSCSEEGQDQEEGKGLYQGLYRGLCQALSRWQQYSCAGGLPGSAQLGMAEAGLKNLPLLLSLKAQ